MPDTPTVCLIAALARNRVIGAGQALPWHLPQDMAHFRRATTGHAVLMGRKTWESLPAKFRPLPGRRNVVLTRRAGYQAAGAEVATSLGAALQRLHDADKVFVIGGAEVYAQALPLADELLLTEIDRDFHGDAYFPALPAGWVEVQREAHQAAAPNDFGFAFVTYRKAG